MLIRFSNLGLNTAWILGEILLQMSWMVYSPQKLSRNMTETQLQLYRDLNNSQSKRWYNASDYDVSPQVFCETAVYIA